MQTVSADTIQMAHHQPLQARVRSELLLSAPARQARKHSTAVGLISGQGSRNSCWPSAAAPCFAAAKTASTTICANAAQSKSGVTQAAQVSPFGKLNCKTSTTSASKKSQAPSKSKAATPQAAQPAPIDSGAAAADPACPKASVTTVAQDADVMLNQTNIGQNNNKFYRMQLLQEQNADHWLWSRWGRVGDKGQTKLAGPVDAVTGYKEFKKLFRSKVGAKFEDKHDARQVRRGKYSLVDLDSFESPPVSSVTIKAAKVASQYVKSKLELPTQELIDLIFSDAMFQEAMQEFDIDTDKLPLGQLSKAQVQRGYDVLTRLRAALNTDSTILERLSSEFYQVISHSFGRSRPPIIQTSTSVDAKIEMCNVLNDIAMAQDMLEAKQAEEEEQQPKADLPTHPADEKYANLMADMTIIQPSEEEYKIIDKYCQATGSGEKLLNVWRVDRHSEGGRFAEHSKLDNRRLLWHGTNIAVVAAILKAGLRIMHHARGRVGKGLYLASEHSKSSGYVSCGRRGGDYIGVMFLAEAALGLEHRITRDDPSLKQAPSGFNSVVAKGHREPDPSQDVKLNLDGNAVQVSQGKPISMSDFEHSSFSQSEYLVYNESQARIRYMVTMKFSRVGAWH